MVIFFLLKFIYFFPFKERGEQINFVLWRSSRKAYLLMAEVGSKPIFDLPEKKRKENVKTSPKKH